LFLIPFIEDIPIVQIDVQIARRLIGTGIGFIACGLIIPMIKCVNRNFLWNVGSMFLISGAFFVLTGTCYVWAIPSQHKFMLTIDRNVVTYQDVFEQNSTTTSATTTTRRPSSGLFVSIC
jgi:hypothetical protein